MVDTVKAREHTKLIGHGQKDLTGQRFGKLVCIAPTEQRAANGSVIWQCQCDCGNKCFVPISQMLSGKTKSCGCLGHPPLKDFVHKRFGSLEVIEYAGKRNKRHYWRCRCDCGNETVVSQSNLLSGHCKSCGCIQKEIHSSNLKLVDGTSVKMIENRIEAPISSNKSGCSGVYLQKKSGKWAAQITFKGKTHYLGTYGTREEAIKARKRGEEMYEEFLSWYYNDYLKVEQEKPMMGSRDDAGRKNTQAG